MATFDGGVQRLRAGWRWWGDRCNWRSFVASWKQKAAVFEVIRRHTVLIFSGSIRALVWQGRDNGSSPWEPFNTRSSHTCWSETHQDTETRDEKRLCLLLAGRFGHSFIFRANHLMKPWTLTVENELISDTNIYSGSPSPDLLLLVNSWIQWKLGLLPGTVGSTWFVSDNILLCCFLATFSVSSWGHLKPLSGAVVTVPTLQLGSVFTLTVGDLLVINGCFWELFSDFWWLLIYYLLFFIQR